MKECDEEIVANDDDDEWVDKRMDVEREKASNRDGRRSKRERISGILLLFLSQQSKIRTLTRSGHECRANGIPRKRGRASINSISHQSQTNVIYVIRSVPSALSAKVEYVKQAYASIPYQFYSSPEW